MKKQISIMLALMLCASMLIGCGGTATKDTTAAAEQSTAAAEQSTAAAEQTTAVAEQTTAAAGNTGSGAKFTIKIGHAAKDGSARDLGAEKIKEVVETMSNGNITVEIYPNSQLGGGPDLIQGMQTNTIEMVILPSSFMGGFQPLTTLMDIPYLFPTDYEKLIQIEHGEAAKALLATTSEIGVETLDIWHTGYKTFTANSKLYVPDDFKGLKFRVMPSQILIAQYETLGATPVNMDFSECYNALSTGAIDGQENPFDTTADMNFQEVQKYLTVSNHGVLDQFVMASKTWWDAMDPADQAIILEGINAGREVCVTETQNKTEASRAKIEEAGVEIHELTEEELAQWKDALAACKDIYVKNYGDRAQELLNMFEAEVAALQ